MALNNCVIIRLSLQIKVRLLCSHPMLPYYHWTLQKMVGPVMQKCFTQ